MGSRLMWATKAASYLKISTTFNRGFASELLPLHLQTMSAEKEVDLKLFVCKKKPVCFCDIEEYSIITATENLFKIQHTDVPLSYYTGILVVKDLKYADSHEWVKVDGNSATVGITDHAQDHLGDVVYVELPEVGTAVTQGSSFGAVESVKATSDINSPVSGKVVEVNEELTSSPGLVNGSPYENGWIIKVEVSDLNEVNSLMDSEKYTKFCEEEDGH